MNQGKVKFFNDEKGFGFIKDSQSNQEYFVHISALIDEIRDNDEVTFEIKEGKRGLNAVNVQLA
ncbi:MULTISPECIES: cold-shock protein [Rufibacter]|uniref:CspA family cold shock protein n=1 Tax=Rufibacter quisquiliarum TaxID=1549639 RepID=A0A839GWE3_9BACT|nr:MULTISPECIES: cold shock domain-containing protein [Rufibacter]MBA9079187.1 CspA family cold shock protein [Rufibacter quisquiliarum]